MTMLVSRSAWGIVTPEICGVRFRQRTSGESDGTGSGLSGGSVALVALRSHPSSRHGAMAVGSRWCSSWIMARSRVAHQQEERPDSTGVGQERRIGGQGGCTR